MISIGIYTYNQIRRIKNEVFERGVNCGIKMAIDELRDVQKYNCIHLTEEEKSEVMKYLYGNNLEFGYDVMEGGFYILKKTKQQEQ